MHSFLFIVKIRAVLLLFIRLNDPLENKQANKSTLIIKKNAFSIPKARNFEAQPR